ncbi:unnamed protein product [Linum tenue]|uniref:Uncharacterized protein n=1 Tax=Linum tenue TaxID=586396 RepID=A0AAV0IB54_9ROSI|nr:unnamed protein product [Linum tenue]
MAKPVKVEIISKQYIKPSSPTPPEKSSLKISVMDELNYVMSTPLVLFYPAADIGPEDDVVSYLSGKSRLLKAALADTLTLYYPYAGVLTAAGTSIDCNDAGIEYVEAAVDGTLSDAVFRRPDPDLLENFLFVQDLAGGGRYVGARVQTTAFACGGMAVAISLTHKIGDGASLQTFLQTWAAAVAAREKSTPIPAELFPEFASDSIILSSSDVGVPLPTPPEARREQVRTTTRRFVFRPEVMEPLRRRCSSLAVERPTRVEAVSAVIWRSLMKINAAKRSAAGLQNQKKESVLVQATNWRTKFNPPLSAHLVGNLSGKLICRAERGADEDLKSLVGYIRGEMRAEHERHFAETSRKKIGVDDVVEGIIDFAVEFKEMHARDDVDLYSFSSLLTFKFHDVDFGWGKPAWVVFTNLILERFVLFLEGGGEGKGGGGVEAMVSIGEDDAAALEEDEELLEFASFNPPVGGGGGGKREGRGAKILSSL